MTHIRIKRVYLQPEKEDGNRILVDRLWPRGLTKEKASVDLWLKEIAPSTELRKWFGHDPAKWAEFQTRYLDELRGNAEQLDRFLSLTGLDLASIRSAATQQGFLAGVLDHIASDESLLIAFASHVDLPPLEVERARAVLSGPAWRRDDA